jgi:hypothetical protein
LFEEHCRGVGVILNMKKPSRIFSLIIFKLRCLLLKKSKYQAKIMWGRCEVDVRSMWGRREVDVRSMWGRCEVDVRSMWGRCEVDVRSMWDRCEIDVMSMWGRCEVDVRLMRVRFSGVLSGFCKGL